MSFLNAQDKLSHRHMKWVESLQAYTFTIKHKKGQANKVVDALSRRALLVQEIQLQSMWVEALKDMCHEDLDFKEVYNVCEQHLNYFHGEFSKFFIA